MSIRRVEVRLDPQPVVRTSRDVDLLRNSEAIAMDNLAFVEFLGDEVTKFRMPIKVERYPTLGLEKERPESRQDALDFVRRYLDAYRDSSAYSITKGPGTFLVSEGLEKKMLFYPGWSFNLTDGEGWWHLILWFEGDLLDEIEISFSPIELP